MTMLLLWIGGGILFWYLNLKVIQDVVLEYYKVPNENLDEEKLADWYNFVFFILHAVAFLLAVVLWPIIVIRGVCKALFK